MTKLTYQKAFEELQKIVSYIEDEEIGLDDLTNKVRRATELIEFCQNRLRSTEEEFNKALSQLEKKTKTVNQKS